VSGEGERAARLAQREDLPRLEVRARGVAGLDGVDLALDPAEDAALEPEEVRGGFERGVQLILEARGRAGDDLVERAEAGLALAEAGGAFLHALFERLVGGREAVVRLAELLLGRIALGGG